MIEYSEYCVQLSYAIADAIIIKPALMLLAGS